MSSGDVHHWQGNFYHPSLRSISQYYEAYSESKYRFAVKKKSSKVSYKILLLSDSTFFKPFPHIRHHY